MFIVVPQRATAKSNNEAFSGNKQYLGEFSRDSEYCYSQCIYHLCVCVVRVCVCVVCV